MSQDGLYHGCWTVFEDGTRCLIKSNWGGCICPTDDPFWKRPQDVESRVEILTEEMDKKLASKRYIKNYFKKLELNNDTNKHKIEQ